MRNRHRKILESIAGSMKADSGSTICLFMVVCSIVLSLFWVSAAAGGETKDEKKLVQQWRREHSNLARYYAPECFDMAVRLERSGNIDGARTYYEKAARLYPKWALPGLHLGLLLLESGREADIEKALDVLKRASISSPDNPRVHKALSMALEKCGEFDEAIKELKKAAELRPGAFTGIDSRLGELYYKAGKVLDAARLYEKVYSSGHGDITILARLADIFEKAGQWQRAEKYLKKLLSHNPDKVYAHYQLARFYGRKGDKRAAKREMRKARILSKKEKRKRKLRPLRPSRR
ncbi:MAG: tetratricopeptide repeat protein [Deltaproteobacteria bacterium]|nr:tetratricopeptide repeat protein [Deltaproteobacteria bacterium]